jgi:hypothetical protein
MTMTHTSMETDEPEQLSWSSGRLIARGSVPGRGKRFVSTSQRLNLNWVPGALSSEQCT